MREVHCSQALAEIYMMKSLLEAEGIEAIIRGEDLVGIQGTIVTQPSIWVADADAARAVELVSEAIEAGGDGQAALESMAFDGLGDGDDDDGEGEAAQAAMGELFVLADRLLHDPSLSELLDEMARLGSLVSESAPPFGIERGVWNRIAELSSAVVDAGGGGGPDETDEQVRERARALRDFLRNYV